MITAGCRPNVSFARENLNFRQMADRKETGKRGETLARVYLENKGYTIERTNYRYRHKEIDVIARIDDVLVFIEVKTRTSVFYGQPGAFFKKPQQLRISTAASFYMEEIDYDWEVRFDLVSIYLKPDGSYELKHFEDVFFPGLH